MGTKYDGAEPFLNYFSGSMDEVRIYDRALSPEEIMMHATNSVVVPPDDTGVMTHTCSSLKCHYIIILNGYTRDVTVNC